MVARGHLNSPMETPCAPRELLQELLHEGAAAGGEKLQQSSLSSPSLPKTPRTRWTRWTQAGNPHGYWLFASLAPSKVVPVLPSRR